MTTLPLTIRLAGRDDAEAVAAFGERAFRETFGPYNRAEDMDAYCGTTYALDRQRREIAEPDRVTILAEVGDELAGYAQLRKGPVPVPIELLRFYVDRPWHGQGLAAALMAEVTARAEERGGRTLYLCVWERNARAIAFYGKQGFHSVGTQLFLLGEDRQVDLVMVRQIGEDSQSGFSAPDYPSRRPSAASSIPLRPGTLAEWTGAHDATGRSGEGQNPSTCRLAREIWASMPLFLEIDAGIWREKLPPKLTPITTTGRRVVPRLPPYLNDIEGFQTAVAATRHPTGTSR